MRLFSYLRWGSRCCFFQRKIEVPQRCKSALQLEDAKQNQRVIQAVASVTTVDGHVTVQADSCWFAERFCEPNESWWRSWIKLRSKGSWVVRPFNMTSHHRILDAALGCFSMFFHCFLCCPAKGVREQLGLPNSQRFATIQSWFPNLPQQGCCFMIRKNHWAVLSSSTCSLCSFS